MYLDGDGPAGQSRSEWSTRAHGSRKGAQFPCRLLSSGCQLYSVDSSSDRREWTGMLKRGQCPETRTSPFPRHVTMKVYMLDKVNYKLLVYQKKK